jgi:hypothetical protein
MSDNKLPGWRETPAKQPVMNSKADRIAVFDNDGTL